MPERALTQDAKSRKKGYCDPKNRNQKPVERTFGGERLENTHTHTPASGAAHMRFSFLRRRKFC